MSNSTAADSVLSRLASPVPAVWSLTLYPGAREAGGTFVPSLPYRRIQPRRLDLPHDQQPTPLDTTSLDRPHSNTPTQPPHQPPMSGSTVTARGPRKFRDDPTAGRLRKVHRYQPIRAGIAFTALTKFDSSLLTGPVSSSRGRCGRMAVNNAVSSSRAKCAPRQK